MVATPAGQEPPGPALHALGVPVPGALDLLAFLGAGLGDRSAHVVAVDAAADEPQQRRDQGQGADDRRDDGDRGREAEFADEAHPGRRTARHRAMITVQPETRTARPLVAAACPAAWTGSAPSMRSLPVTGDQEQGVVDAHAEADHRGQGRGDGGEGERGGQQPEAGQAADHAEQRGHQGQTGRDHTAEADEQDDDRHREADQFAHPVVGGGPGQLAERPAVLDLGARRPQRLDGVVHAVEIARPRGSRAARRSGW